MMRKWVLAIVFLLALVGCPAYAGFYSYSDSIKDGGGDVDPLQNRMYVEIAKVKNARELDKGFTANIAIVDLRTNQITYLFEKGFTEQIESFYFETGVSPEGVVSFNRNYIARNNQRLKEEGIKDKLCICTFNPKTKIYSLWFCDKAGQNLKRVKSFSKEVDWWIDVKNSKVFLMRQVKDRLMVSSIRW